MAYSQHDHADAYADCQRRQRKCEWVLTGESLGRVRRSHKVALHLVGSLLDAPANEVGAFFSAALQGPLRGFGARCLTAGSHVSYCGASSTSPETLGLAMVRASNVESAKRLLGLHQSASADQAQDRAARAGRVLDGIFHSLGPVIGAAGVRATFERSLKLNMAAYPCLKEIATTGAAPQSTNEEVAQRLADCLSNLQPELAATVAISLYATFFDLMSNLIGEDLLWQILKAPRLALEETEAEETE